MKKTSIALGLLLACAGNSFAAEDPTYKSWVGGFVEYYNADSDKPEPIGYLEDGFGGGVEFGFRFKPQWAARLEYSALDIDTDASRLGTQDPNNGGSRIGVDAMYFTKNDAMYLFAGLKHLSIGDNDQVANLGLGKHWMVNDKWRVITEAAVYHDFGEGFRDYGLKLGLAYTFGAKSAPAAPKDSDRDGVYDSQDQCPNTPIGTQVDTTGCNIDSDGDGVANTIDQCPNTPAGQAVDARGCNNDLDGDGVINEIDRCPNTPAGTKVGAKGCSLALDSDQDGVLDQDDQCPETPLTDKVDKIGCSIFAEKEVTVNLQVLFANNSADIDNPNDSQFSDFASFMSRFPNTKAVIEGHTSAVGQASYNQTLSESRANSVKQLLIDQYNIAEDRLTAVGYGEERLLDSSNTPEASRMNRRIEAKVTAIDKVKVLKN